jgi:hypothetical protein
MGNKLPHQCGEILNPNAKITGKIETSPTVWGYREYGATTFLVHLKYTINYI